MPAQDIRPFKSPLGGHIEIRYGSLTTAGNQLWLEGWPVNVEDAGTIDSPPADTTEWVLADMDTVGNVCGIACFGTAGDDGDGTVSTVGAPINPDTGVAYAAGDEVAFYPADQGNLFITSNFHDAATTAAVVPAQTDVGEIYQLSHSVTAAAGLGWGIEQTAGVPGTDVLAVIHDVLDSRLEPIRISGNAGVYLVFELKTK